MKRLLKLLFSTCILISYNSFAQDSKSCLIDLEKYITSKEWRIKSLEIKDDIFYFHFNDDFTSFPILETEDKVTIIENGILIKCKEENKCINWFGIYTSTYKLEGNYDATKLASLFDKTLKAYRNEKNGIIQTSPDKPIATQSYEAFTKVKVTDINMNGDWNYKKIKDANEVLNKTFILLEKTAPNKYGEYRCNFLGKNGTLLYLEDVSIVASDELSETDKAYNTQQYPSITQSSDTFLKKGTPVLVYFIDVESYTKINTQTAQTILGKLATLNQDILKSALYDEYASYPVDITIKATGKRIQINSAKCISLQPIVYKKPEIKKIEFQNNSTNKQFTDDDVVKEMIKTNTMLNEKSKVLKYTTVSEYSDVCSFLDNLLNDYPNNFDNSYIQQYNLFATQLNDGVPVLYDFGKCRFHLKDVETDEVSMDYNSNRKMYKAYMLPGNTSMDLAKKKYLELREAILKCDIPYGQFQLEENKEQTTFIIRNPTKINPGFSETYKNMYILVRLLNRNEVPDLVKNSYEKYAESVFIYIEIE